MFIRACCECNFHEIKPKENSETSYCRKEGCWSLYANCIMQKALERFLHEELRAPDSLQHPVI